MRFGRGWRAVVIDEIEAIDWRGIGMTWRPLRQALGVEIVGMAAFTAERVGAIVIEPHTDVRDGRGHQEVYVVVTGAAEFVIDGDRFEAAPGMVVRVDADAHRQASALQPHTTILALGGESTFDPGASEWIERARPHIRTDPDRARRIIDDLGRGQPNSRGRDVGEALLAVGRGDEAGARTIVVRLLREVPDIRTALEQDPDLRDLVPT